MKTNSGHILAVSETNPPQSREKLFCAGTALAMLVAAGLLGGCGKATQRSPDTATGNSRQEAKQTEEAVEINYASLDFAKLQEAHEATLERVKGVKGDEAAVLQAWAGVLKNLLKVRSEMERTGKVLAESDILNINTITNGLPSEVSEQFVARRKIANARWSAINDWQNELHWISRTYQGGLAERGIPAARAQSELTKMTRALVDKAKAEADLCEADKKPAQEYNYAVGAMENYYHILAAHYSNNRQTQVSPGVAVRQLPWEAKNQPDPVLADYARKYEQEVAKVEQSKKEAQELRRPMTASN